MSDSEKEQNEGEEAAKSPEDTSETSSASDETTDDADDSKSKKDDEEGSESDEDEDDGDGDGDGDEAEGPKSAKPDDERGSSASLLVGVLALAAGFGIGWFGHDYQVQKAAKTADAAVQGEGEGARGPCKDWETALCAKFGDTSFPCTQAQSGSSLLSGAACEQALKSIDGQVKKIEESRASCNDMMNKLCSELGAESKACELVKTQTPSFPPQRCDDMMKNYDQVLSQLKMMEQRGAIPGAGGPGGPGGPGGRPPMHGGGHPPAVRVSPSGAPGGPAPGGPAPGGPAPAPKVTAPAPVKVAPTAPTAPAPAK